MNICHEASKLINKQFLDFLYPYYNRFFTSIFESLLNMELVKDDWATLCIQITHFSLDFQIIHIQRQNCVKFNTNNHRFFNLSCLKNYSHTKALFGPRTVPSSVEPLLRVKPEAAWTTEGKGRGEAQLGDWFPSKWI